MKRRFTIGWKIGAGFGFIIFFIIVVFYVTIQNIGSGIEVFEKKEQIQQLQDNIEKPVREELNNLRNLILQSKGLIIKWATVASREDDLDKILLIKITEDSIPVSIHRLKKFNEHWNDKEQQMLRELEQDVSVLFDMHDQIKNSFSSIESYNDQLNVFMVTPLIAADGDITKQTNKVIFEIDDLIKRQEKRSEKTSEELRISREKTKKSFNFLFWLVVIMAGAAVISSVFIATLTTRSIVRPIRNVKAILTLLGRGIIPKQKIKPRNDEIGDMAVALNTLIDGFQSTTEFSKQIGAGNFNYRYKPLSDEDVLGHALLKMRDDLAENERILEQKVIERTEEVVRQKEEIEKQRQKLEELYKDVTDSIRYAKRLQESILPPDNFIKQLLPESFVLYKPKDIVSGDFYWFYKKENKILFAAVDCTGHGVPGAFMSLVGANALNQAVKEHGVVQPAKILEDINKLSSETLNKNNENNTVRDGMDLALCSIDKKSMELEYAGANNPLYLIRNNELIEIKADKFAIGAFEPGTKNYTNHKWQLQKGDKLYVFSDGYADQFGGLKGKKFMYRQFRDVLLKISDKNMQTQKQLLLETLEKWKGMYEQVDDILVIGVEI
jgi:serine phosphatase RsbU (regulator of sigma subunit)